MVRKSPTWGNRTIKKKYFHTIEIKKLLFHLFFTSLQGRCHEIMVAHILRKVFRVPFITTGTHHEIQSTFFLGWPVGQRSAVPGSAGSRSG
jgi:hypothetical protein